MTSIPETPMVIERLVVAEVGGCTCLTKSPEISYHKPDCHYRLFREAWTEIKRLNTWADGFSDAQLKERRLAEERIAELTATRARITPDTSASAKMTEEMALASQDAAQCLRRAIAAERLAQLWKAERHIARQELNEAWHEAQTCDDINLDQPLAGIIADLEKDREDLHAEINDLNALLEKVREHFPATALRDGGFIVSFAGNPAEVAAMLDAVLFPRPSDEEKAKAMGENW